MKIWERIIFGFILIIIVMIIVDINAIINNIEIINHIEELEHSKRIELSESNKVAYLIQRIKSNQRKLFLDFNAHKSLTEIESTHNEIESNIIELNNSLRVLNNATQKGLSFSKDSESSAKELEELILIDSLHVLTNIFIADVNETFEFQNTNNIGKAEYFFEYKEEPISIEIQDLVSTIVKNDEREIAWAINQLGKKVNKTIKLGIYLTILSILLSLVIGLYIARSISRPLYKLIYGTREIEKGNLETTVKVETKGELQLLADSFNDMSKELKRRIETINHLNKELKESNQTKDKYFSIIAHDLKNPFNVILGFTDLLVEQYKDFSDTERQEIILELNNSSKIIYSLLENLLTWSRSQSGKIELRPKMIKLNSLVRNSIISYKGNATQKKISIESSISDNITIYADELTMSVVINNILNNAIKFTPEYGKIIISAIKSDNQVEVSIKDTGVGMSQKIVDKLLRSERIESTSGTSNEKGTGLGLILVKDFLERNHGIISILSESGNGTDFRFKLPTSSFEKGSFH